MTAAGSGTSAAGAIETRSRTPAANSTVKATVTAAVQYEDRTDRVLIHSARAIREKVRRGTEPRAIESAAARAVVVDADMMVISWFSMWNGTQRASAGSAVYSTAESVSER